MPEKERVQMTNDLIADRVASLKKQQEEASKLPDKEESTVTRELIADKIKWLQEQQQKASELPEQQQLELTNELISNLCENELAGDKRHDSCLMC